MVRMLHTVAMEKQGQTRQVLCFRAQMILVEGLNGQRELLKINPGIGVIYCLPALLNSFPEATHQLILPFYIQGQAQHLCLFTSGLITIRPRSLFI